MENVKSHGEFLYNGNWVMFKRQGANVLHLFIGSRLVDPWQDKAEYDELAAYYWAKVGEKE